MKTYISAAVPIAKLREQFAPEMEDKTFQDLIDIDPSADFGKNRGGKYCPWIFRQYNKGNLKESDYTNLKDALGYFLNNYRKYPKSDLGQYKTVEEFLSDTEAVGNRELTDKEKAKLLKKKAHHASTDDKKFIVEDGVWEVWQPLTYPGSISLAREGGTKASWCTAYEGDDFYYNRYTREGPLYVFLNTSDPKEKYQLHFESDSWYDINDNSLGLRAFYKFCSEHPAIGEYFEIETKDGIQTRGGAIVGFDEDTTEIIVPEGMIDISGLSFPQSVETIVLPDSFLQLEERMFYNLPNLISVVLPKTITEIPRGCFAHCTSIESIDIPDSVRVYQREAFYGCANLITINHSSSLKIVHDLCFKDCPELISQLPDSVVYIGSDIFNGCSSMPVIDIPSSITELKAKAFLNSDVEEVVLNNVTKVGPSAFNGASIERLNLGSVVIISGGAFRSCNSLHDVDLDLGGMKVGAYAFADSAISGTITVDDSTDLSVSAFDNCPNLTVVWNRADEPYDFENIGLLKCSESSCPELIKNNKGYIKIETTEGNTYEVQ